MALLLAGCSASEGDPVSAPASDSATDESDRTDAPASTATTAGEADATDDTDTDPDSDTERDDAAGVEPGVVPVGFSTVTALITKPDGSTCEVCMWLADTSAERQLGLMGVTDLGAPEAMVFLFDRPTSGTFFMFQTVLPLSIAWFAADGSFVSSTDMDPCLGDDSALCARFAATGEYRVAVEVLQGDLDANGLIEGSRIELLIDTESLSCSNA